MYDAVSGARFVLANAKLHGLADPAAAAKTALETVQMTSFADRDIATYSKGMKQRIKIATALVHDPPVLLLDEPFNGMDPRQRLQLMELLHTMGERGRTILFSSHILEEVEQIAGDIEVMVAGRHAASGDFHHIRRLMTERPHQYWIRSDDDRALASAIMARTSAAGVELVSANGGRSASGRARPTTGRRDTATALHVQASDVSQFVRTLPQLAAEHGIRLYEVSPADESLESVFSYLVAR
jgi:ABC-2 type transport system ATP-binding protein